MNPLKKLILKCYQWARAKDEELRYNFYREKYNIHTSARFNGPGTIINGDGGFSLGAGSYVGMHSLFTAEAGYEITIGSNTAVGHYCCIYTKSSPSDEDFSKERKDQRTQAGSVRIGNACWIGYRVFIREGVTIGDHVTVGAHSVVTHDLLERGVYAGVPAKRIKGK